MIRTFAISLILLLFCCGIKAQPIGIDLLGNKDKIELPFKYIQGFIVVDIEIDKTLPLKFIFDTGAEHTIMFHKIMADLIDMHYTKRIRILGSDISHDVHALIARNILIDLKKGVTVKRDILVLEDEISKLREAIGEEISGILGTSLFKGMVLSIDYKKKKIVITHPKEFKAPKPGSGYKAYDIDVVQNKAYLKAPVTLQNGNTISSTLLLDTGAAIPLLIHANTDSSLVLPDLVIDGRLGYGLGGPIKGFLGKVKKLDLDEYRFDFVLTSFQDIDLKNISGVIIRNGILGNKLLSRFKVIIDYFNKKLYLKPTRKYNANFKYDLSGLELIAFGKDFKSFSVSSVVKDSPADEADIRPGDKIKKIGWFGAKFYTLEKLIKKLESKPGKRIKLKIERDGETMTKIFYLRDLFIQKS